MTAYARQLQAAQRVYDNQSDDHLLASPADEARDEAIDAMLADPKWRAANKAAADEQNDGTFSGEHYTAVEIALADLAETPIDKLVGSDALAFVLRLAQVHGDERDARLREIAEVEYDRDVAA